MKYKNAYSGIKLLFFAQILFIIAYALIIITASAVIIQNPEANITISTLSLTGPEKVFLLIGTVVLLIAAIVDFVGYIKGAIDDVWFLVALICILGEIVLSTIAGFSKIDTAEILNGLVSFLGDLIVIFAIFAIISLSKKVNDPETGSFANKFLWIQVIIAVASLILVVVSGVIENSLSSSIILITIRVLTVVSYIMFLVCLKKAKRMLELTNK